MCSLPKASGDVLRGDAERRHARRQQVHADGAVAPPADAHLAHAVDGLELLLDDVDRVQVELLLRAVALQRGLQDRLRCWSRPWRPPADRRPVGSRRTTWFTFACTSWKATSIRFSRLKVMVTTEAPGDEVDWMCSMPGTLFTAVSIRLVIEASMMSGFAPRWLVVIEMTGNSM